jgi:hypothetical protein
MITDCLERLDLHTRLTEKIMQARFCCKVNCDFVTEQWPVGMLRRVVQTDHVTKNWILESLRIIELY